MTSARFLTALAVAALLAACGKDSSSKNSLDDLNDYAAAYADAMCSALVTCSCTVPAAKGDCKIAYTEQILLEGSVMVSRFPGVVLDKAAAKTCLADLKAELGTCPSPTPRDPSAPPPPPPVPALRGAPLAPRDSGPSSTLPSPDSCAKVFVGSRLEGDYCSSYQECAAGLACDDGKRTCVTPPGEGASCQDTYDSPDPRIGCADGLYCDNDYVCTKIPAVGEVCDGDPESCAEGSRCVAVDGGYRCVAPHVADASCVDGAGCVSGLYCDPGSGTCKALVADGQDCTSSYQCAHGSCSAEHKCVDAGFCSLVGEESY